MRRTEQEIKGENKLVYEYMHSTADLSVENVSIIWKTGIFIALLFVVLFVASYYVSDNTIAWLLYLMPLGAYLLSRRYRIRKTIIDIQFQQIWQNMWGIAAPLAFVPLFYKDISVYGVFVVYYIVILIGLFILYDLMRVRYAAIVICGGCGIALSGFRTALEPETTIRWCLGTFILFDVIVFMLSGAAMQWQVKNRVANPVNFPQPK